MLMQRYIRSITSCNHLGGTYIIPQRAFSSSNTDKNDDKKPWIRFKYEDTPMWILAGFTSLAALLAVTSVTRQLIHHPGVQVNKSNRSMVPEVDSPELSHAYGDKFISKSVIRKVAHSQKRDDTVATNRGDIYTTEGFVYHPFHIVYWVNCRIYFACKRYNYALSFIIVNT